MKLLLKIFASLFVCVILAGAQTALAEDSMYRCGNTFQDTPCKGVVSKPINEPKPKKPVVTIHHEAAEKKVAVVKEQPAPALPVDCKKQGEDAKVIAKLREIGVPEQDQIIITTDKTKITLIKKVYSLSGNAFQIQSSVEKECLQQTQKTSLTSQWMTKAKKLLGLGAAPAPSKPKPAPAKIATKPAQAQIRSTADPKPVIEPAQPALPAAAPVEPSPPAVPAPQSEPAPEPAAKPAPSPEPVAPPVPEKPAPAPAKPEPAPAPAPAQEEAQDDPQGICSSLQKGLKNVNDQLKKGGDAATMTDLKNQKTQLERIYKSSGC